MAIYGSDGPFGSGKSSFAVLQAYGLIGKRTLVLTNMNLERAVFKNYVKFDDDKLLRAFRTLNWINDIEREHFFFQVSGYSLKRWQREKFTHFLVIFDEAGAHANANEWRSQDVAGFQYVNQCRKNFMDLLVVTAAGDQVLNSLRKFVEIWFYSRPLFNFGVFKDIKVVRAQEREADGRTPKFKKVIGKDSKGEPKIFDVPVDWLHTVYFQPKLWGLYDDLHKNIEDPQKRIGADPLLVMAYCEAVGLEIPAEMQRELDEVVLLNSPQPGI